MRFVWAVVAFVLAAGLIAAGIAQRTIFMGPSTQEVSVAVEEPAPYVLLDGDVLREHPGSQTLLVRGKVTSSRPTVGRPTWRRGWPTPRTTT